MLAPAVMVVAALAHADPSPMPMAYHEAFEHTMRHEIGSDPRGNGGLVNDSRDPGGLTQWGLSSRANPDLDIGNLTRSEAKVIYYRRYWSPLRLDDVSDPRIAAEIFDTGVNLGTGRAAKIVQKSINLLNRAYRQPQLAVDGVIGPRTLGWIKHWSNRDGVALMALLNGFQWAHYIKVITAKPSMIYALRSWMRRTVPPQLG